MAKSTTKTNPQKKSQVHLIKGPRVTEKAGINAEKGAYTFHIDRTATKDQIKSAIKELYNVTPVKINITNLPAKKISRRGIPGRKQAIRKAVVFLKKGDTIAFI